MSKSGKPAQKPARKTKSSQSKKFTKPELRRLNGEDALNVFGLGGGTAYDSSGCPTSY